MFQERIQNIRQFYPENWLINITQHPIFKDEFRTEIFRTNILYK